MLNFFVRPTTSEIIPASRPMKPNEGVPATKLTKLTKKEITIIIIATAKAERPSSFDISSSSSFSVRLV